MIELDGSRMTDRKTTHDHLAEQLGLPDYYGRNLDALYDIVTDAKEARDIRVINVERMREQLGQYAQLLLLTLQEAETDCLNLTVTIEE